MLGSTASMQNSQMGRSAAPSQSAVGGVQDVASIVKSVRADIAHLKAQLESIPPFPEGKW